MMDEDLRHYNRCRKDVEAITRERDALRDRLEVALCARSYAVQESIACREKLERILGMSNPYPLSDILRLLTEDVDHLLNVHNCDHVGHETKKYVCLQALKYIEEIRDARLVSPEMGVGETQDAPMGGAE